MNQILVTKKLYITPELKKKKKAYKAYFFLSVFLICILTSVYIYAEYDRNKNEEASASLLEDFNQENAELANKKNILVAVLDGNDEGTNSDSTTPKSQSAINKNKNVNTPEYVEPSSISELYPLYDTLASLSVTAIAFFMLFSISFLVSSTLSVSFTSTNIKLYI